MEATRVSFRTFLGITEVKKAVEDKANGFCLVMGKLGAELYFTIPALEVERELSGCIIAGRSSCSAIPGLQRLIVDVIIKYNASLADHLFF